MADWTERLSCGHPVTWRVQRSGLVGCYLCASPAYDWTRSLAAAIAMSGPFVVGPFGSSWPAGSWTVDPKAPDISEAETVEIKLPVCTANPSCGEDDVICPQCKAGNCPGVKCWRGCGQ